MTSFHDRIQEVEHLADTLDGLLAHNGDALERGHLYHRALTLTRWINSYHDGLRYGVVEGDHPIEAGRAWLAGVNDRLRLEAQELHSLDERGEEEAEQPEIGVFIEAVHQIISAAFALETLSPYAAVSSQSMSTLKENDMLQTRVRDLMEEKVVIIPSDYTLREAAQEMDVANCGMLPVGSLERIEGIITDRDIVLRAVAKGSDINKELVRDHMTSEIHCVHEDDPTYRAADLMRQKNINRLLVKDGEGKPRGILTFGRIIRQNENMQEIAVVIECIAGRKAA